VDQWVPTTGYVPTPQVLPSAPENDNRRWHPGIAISHPCSGSRSPRHPSLVHDRRHDESKLGGRKRCIMQSHRPERRCVERRAIHNRRRDELAYQNRGLCSPCLADDVISRLDTDKNGVVDIGKRKPRPCFPLDRDNSGTLDTADLPWTNLLNQGGHRRSRSIHKRTSSRRNGYRRAYI
jgi:hypothetical protein